MGIPFTYEEAIGSENRNSWENAMKSEIDSLEANDTFTVVQRPEGKHVVDGKWVYNVKEANDEVRFKARYVAKGYSQVQGINYDETFSPTVNMTSVRILAQLAVQYDMSIHQMDMKTAYLNAPIEHELYVEMPKGYASVSMRQSQVWRLNKSLYGLKQSGRNWHLFLKSFLEDSCGFKQSVADPCVFTKTKGDSMVILLVWVDDILIATNDERSLKEIKDKIKSSFKVTDFGKLSYFLGIQFSFDQDSIRMDQSRYIEKILSRFGMADCKAQKTPCEMKLQFSEQALPFEDNSLYREVIGNLIYLMTSTRPDIAFVVTKLSQFLVNPTVEHYACAKRVLRYLKGTADQALTFTKSDHLALSGYTDADWANSADDRKSISGYCFTLNPKRGGLISWRSKKQPIVALSSCEAEYIALCYATKEGIFLRQVLRDIGVTSSGIEKFTIHGDNQGTLALVKSHVKRERSKHIDIKYHFVRHHFDQGSLALMYVSSSDNFADMFTKAVGNRKLSDFSTFLFG